MNGMPAFNHSTKRPALGAPASKSAPSTPSRSGPKRWRPTRSRYATRRVKQRAEAEGVTVEEAANEAVRLGLSEDRWQKLMKRGRNYSREMAEAATDDDALQIA